MQPLWTSSEATGIRKALREETRPSGQAVRPTALSNPCTPAPAETPPWTLSFPWDQPFFCFILGGSWPGGGAATGSPTFAFHPTSVQTLQELQGWSTVRTEWGSFWKKVLTRVHWSESWTEAGKSFRDSCLNAPNAVPLRLFTFNLLSLFILVCLSGKYKTTSLLVCYLAWHKDWKQGNKICVLASLELMNEHLIHHKMACCGFLCWTISWPMALTSRHQAFNSIFVSFNMQDVS